jgi:hypothetical protein
MEKKSNQNSTVLLKKGDFSEIYSRSVFVDAVPVK